MMLLYEYRPVIKKRSNANLSLILSMLIPKYT